MWKSNLLEKRQFIEYEMLKQLAIHLKENTARPSLPLYKNKLQMENILKYYKQKLEFKLEENLRKYIGRPFKVS